LKIFINLYASVTRTGLQNPLRKPLSPARLPFILCRPIRAGEEQGMFKKIATVATALLTGGFTHNYVVHPTPVEAPDGRTAHDFTLTAIDGSPLPLSQFKGQVLLVVNTAS